MSRQQRRAARRLAIKQAAYDNMVKADRAGGKGYTKPGRGKHW